MTSRKKYYSLINHWESSETLHEKNVHLLPNNRLDIGYGKHVVNNGNSKNMKQKKMKRKFVNLIFPDFAFLKFQLKKKHVLSSTRPTLCLLF